MSALPANSQQAYVPPSFILPEDPEQFRIILTEILQKVVDALNVKDIGQYNTVELLSGQTYFTSGNPAKLRQVYRKVIDFGALPSVATKTVAHGITWNANTRFTRIYGAANEPSVNSIPLPYVDTVTANLIELKVDATNVIVITKKNYTAFTDTYIVLEYVQN